MSTIPCKEITTIYPLNATLNRVKKAIVYHKKKGNKEKECHINIKKNEAHRYIGILLMLKLGSKIFSQLHPQFLFCPHIIFYI